MFLFQKVNHHLATLPLFPKGCYGYQVVTTCCHDHLTIMSLFQEVIMTNPLCLCSAPTTPPLLPSRRPIWKVPTPEL